MSESPTFSQVILALIKLTIFPILSFQWFFRCERLKIPSKGPVFGLFGMIGMVLLGIVFLTIHEMNPGGKSWSTTFLIVTIFLYLYVARQNLILITRIQEKNMA